MDGILDYLRVVMGRHVLEHQADVDLVRRFVSQNDDAAFAALLKRHGPMVLGICRRVLHDEHLAEDALQATFLVLAQNAKTLRKQRSVASWLHGVALRVARKAKCASASAKQPDTRNSCRSSNDPQDEASWRENLHILDAELQRLPDKYRLPLVLCYLEGQTRDEAAAQLGWTTGKLRGQLERARDLLRSRLLRRGVTLAEAGAGFLLADTALAARVPPMLAVATVKAASRYGAGKTLASCGVSASVIALTKGGVSVMGLKAVALFSALVLVTGLLGAGAGIMASPRGAGQAGETSKSASQSKSPAIKKSEAGPQLPAVDAFGDPLPAGAVARFGSTRWRHGEAINASALSGDGKRLVTSSGRSVVVWDTANGKILRRFDTDFGISYSQASLTISPDGKRIGYVHNQSFAFVWDLETGKELQRFGKDLCNNINGGQFTANGKEFVVVDRDRFLFWDLEMGKEKRSVPAKGVSLLGPYANTYIAVSPEEEMIVGDALTGAEIHRGLGTMDAIAIAPDGQSMALVKQAKRQIQIWEYPKLKLLKSFPLPKSASYSFGAEEHFDFHLSFSGDSKVLFLGTVWGLTHRWDLGANKELPPLDKHIVRVFSTVSGAHNLPDGRTVVTVGVDGLIRRWDAASGKEHKGHQCYEGNAIAAFTPDGRLVVIADSGGKVDLWDAKTGKALRTFRKEGPIINKLAFAPDGKCLAVGFRSGDVAFYDVPSGRESKALREDLGKPVSGLDSYVNVLLFSPDGRFLYVSDYANQGRLWNIGTGEVSWRGGWVMSAAWAPDGKTIVVSLGKTLALLDATTGELGTKLDASFGGGDLECYVTSLAFSPDGRQLALGGYPGILALNDGKTLTQRKQINTFSPPKHVDKSNLMKLRELSSGADCLAFSADDKWLITGSVGGAIRIWDTFSLTEVFHVEGHEVSFHVGLETSVKTVSFSPDGKTALSSGSDGQAYLWDLRPKDDGKPKQPLEALWTDLASSDAKLAYRAVWALSDDPKSVDLLAKKISAAQPVDKKTLAKLLTDLDSDNFQTRQGANKTLSDLGDLAAQALADALKMPPSLETEQRMRRLLDAIEGELPPSVIQQMRALKALELAGTEPARRLLQQWADGAAGARLTEESKAALVRLAKRER